jgi:hypothetical protein
MVQWCGKNRHLPCGAGRPDDLSKTAIAVGTIVHSTLLYTDTEEALGI